MIYLVRDPRAVMSSRFKTDFCKLSEECYRPETLEKDLSEDYEEAVRLRRDHPKKFRVVRYCQKFQPPGQEI